MHPSRLYLRLFAIPVLVCTALYLPSTPQSFSLSLFLSSLLAQPPFSCLHDVRTGLVASLPWKIGTCMRAEIRPLKYILSVCTPLCTDLDSVYVQTGVQSNVAPVVVLLACLLARCCWPYYSCVFVPSDLGRITAKIAIRKIRLYRDSVSIYVHLWSGVLRQHRTTHCRDDRPSFLLCGPLFHFPFISSNVIRS